MSKNPLGEASDYPREYAPSVLFGVPRQEARSALGIGGELPFAGVDVWNAWELTWQDLSGKPVVATATIRVPAASTNIIESKSLKLYLNSIASTRFTAADAVAALLSDDLSKVADAPVTADITLANQFGAERVRELPGTCIDDVTGEFAAESVDPMLLRVSEHEHAEEIYTNVFRSNCPVTNQPDNGSVLIRYAGPRIDHVSLLQYLVSYREHNGFHEACIEQIFVDIKTRCQSKKLTVYGRYNRRGGIDINPFRTDFDDRAEELRLWRQ